MLLKKLEDLIGIIPIMSKKLFHDLRKLELIFTSEELKKDAIKKYGTSVITYWKFSIERMQKLGY